MKVCGCAARVRARETEEERECAPRKNASRRKPRKVLKTDASVHSERKMSPPQLHLLIQGGSAKQTKEQNVAVVYKSASMGKVTGFDLIHDQNLTSPNINL